MDANKTNNDNEVPEFEAVSGLPLLKPRRQPCHHPAMEIDQMEFVTKNTGGLDLELWEHFDPFDPMPRSREGHRGKLWDPCRFHRPDGLNWYEEYMIYWYRKDFDDSGVWYGAPVVSFRVNHCPIISRANSSSF